MNEETPRAGPHDLLIDVLGERFYITAGEGPDYLDEVLRQYQMAIAYTQGISEMKDNPLRVAILTGFLLCDEINKLKLQVKEDQANAEARRTDDEQEIIQITEDLITRLDFIMKETNSLDE